MRPAALPNYKQIRPTRPKCQRVPIQLWYVIDKIYIFRQSLLENFLKKTLNFTSNTVPDMECFFFEKMSSKIGLSAPRTTLWQTMAFPWSLKVTSVITWRSRNWRKWCTNVAAYSSSLIWVSYLIELQYALHMKTTNFIAAIFFDLGWLILTQILKDFCWINADMGRLS